MDYLRANANFESLIVGLILLFFVVVAAQATRSSFERETPLGVHSTNASSPAIGE